jgi:hypothetical protein
LRSRYRKAGELGSERAQPDAAILGQQSLPVAQVIIFGGSRSENIEALVICLGHGEITDELAGAIEHGRENEPALLRHAVGESRRQPAFRARSRHFVFGIAGDLEDAAAVSHRSAFLRHIRKGVGAPEGHFFDGLLPLGCEPQGLLEPVARSEARPHGLEAVVERRGAQRPCGRQLLIGKGDAEATAVVFPNLGIGVGHGRP